jgi:SAM-dependent methyltransferase
MSPQRICPKCGTPQEIAAESALWPCDWRCAHCGFAHDHRNGFVQLAPALDDVNEGFELASYEVLHRIEEGHFWFTARNRMIRWLIERFAPRASRGLEIGCGTGYVLFALRDALPAARLSGSELHSAGLEHARHRHGTAVELFQMDARHSGLSSTLDLIGAFDVLEHIEEDTRVLDEIHTMLKPGGILIATVPQHPWLWSPIDEYAHHCRRYKVGELAEKARRAGFKTRYVSSFASFSLPLMALDRLRAKDGDGEPESAAMPPVINAVLKVIFWCEEIVRRARIPLPFGGSTVLVAEKPA